MRRYDIKKYLPGAALAFVLALSFFFPNAAANVMDARMLDNLLIVNAQSISFETEPELSLPERIALAASQNTEMLYLATGKTMSMETAKAAAVRELSELFSFSSFEFSTDDCVVEDGTVAFIVEADNPSVNMIVWEFRVLDHNANEVIVTTDDETGFVMKLIYQQRRGALTYKESLEDGYPIDRDKTYVIAMQIADMLTEYYGFPVRLGDYQLSSSIAYYRTDMYGRGEGLVIPMYGVIRESSFTINERL